MAWDTDLLINDLISQRVKFLQRKCQIKESSNSSTICTTFFIGKYSEDFIVVSLLPIWSICDKLRQLKPGICLLISSFSTCMIAFKIAKQAKFQLKHNRRDFFNSTRVAIVIASQTIMNIFIFDIICHSTN